MYKRQDWEYIVKMMIIMRDLMCGNRKLRELGFKEEALGHNAIAAGFQGPVSYTHLPLLQDLVPLNYHSTNQGFILMYV